MKSFLGFWKKYSYVMLISFIMLGLLDLRIGIIAIICMVAPVILSIFKGRFWCGNLCPRGNFYDNIVSKFSGTKKIPRLLKSKYFRIFIIVTMFTMFGFGIKNNWGNPYGIGMVFYRMIVVTTLVGVVLSFIFNHRTWCSFCPMGSTASVISHFRGDKKKTLNVDSNCVSCRICEKKCAIGIVPYEYKGNALTHPDCIQCGECVTVCPKKSIGYN